jgi:hypothetical protein
MLLACCAPPFAAQALERQALHANDATAQDSFGSAAALSGAFALVGAELDDLALRTDAGSAYLFERDAAGVWVQRAKLTAADRATGDHFGTAVALGAERALVGADGDDDQGNFSGSAYVFERNASGAWLQVAKLLPGDGAAFDIFGDSVALSGDRALVGAPGNSGFGAAAGAAYVFERHAGGTWVQTAKLGARDAAPQSFFGARLTLAGERALIGAFADDHLASDAGAAYLFELGPAPLGAAVSGGTPGQFMRPPTWRQVAKLSASDASAGAAFGCAVALAGDRALIGAFGDDERGTDAGAGYLFERASDGAWLQRAKLLAPLGAAGDVFGANVALTGQRALVAAVHDDDLGPDAGSVHVFTRAPTGLWSWSEELHASDGSSGEGFGEALAARGELAVASAPRADGPVLHCGAAYVFDLVP